MRRRGIWCWSGRGRVRRPSICRLRRYSPNRTGCPTKKGPAAMLARWPAHPRDIDHNPTPAAIRARPAVPIMRLRDYDHD